MSSHVACIVLAAGRSTRMGTINKLLADLDGKPLVRHAVEAALASNAAPVLVVTGNRGADVAGVLEGLEVVLVDNPDFADGLSTSLKCGINAVPPVCAGALIMLGDMPRVQVDDLDRLISAFVDGGDEAIVVPVHGGRRGNPVLWPAAYFPELLALEGDTGARGLLTAHADKVREVEIGSDAIFVDVDTPEALARERGGG